MRRERTLTGREANEVGATAAAAGIPSQGAAGSSIESVSNLRCTIDPNEIKQKACGGAECSYGGRAVSYAIGGHGDGWYPSFDRAIFFPIINTDTRRS